MTKRRNVLLVVPNLGDGGTPRAVTMLAGALADRGRSVTLVTLDGKSGAAYDVPSGVRRIALGREPSPLRRTLGRGSARLVDIAVRALPPRFAGRPEGIALRIGGAVFGNGILVLHPPARRLVRALRGIVADLRPDAVLAFCGGANVIAILACAARGPRLVVSERTDPARHRLRFPWQGLRERLYRRADAVTANSAGALETLRGYVPDAKLRYVPNLLWESAASGAVGGPPRILIVARLVRVKAHDVLLDAFAAIAGELPEWRLSVVGRGEEEGRLRERAGRLGIVSRIDWHGHVADPYVHYRSAQIFVLPSRHEGQPNALLEAMSVGLPPIVSDASAGPLELVRPGETGLVVPVDDRGALARAMLALARDGALRARLGAAARRAVERHRRPNAVAAWEALIDEDGAT